MTNVTRRKIRKLASEMDSHVTPAMRKVNKIEDGIPVQSLSDAQSRYWANVNRYAKLTGADIPPYLKVLLG